jgi:endonuclease-3 related protein
VEKTIMGLKSRHLLALPALLRLPPSRLAPIIRSTGFYNVKARRLAALLRWLHSAGGFDGISRTPTRELRSQLLACPGVGPETADSILLYALGRPVFVIDAYTRRILSIHGLIKGKEPYDDLRLMFEAALPRSPRVYNECHALLVRLAKSHCRARPLCSGCPLCTSTFWYVRPGKNNSSPSPSFGVRLSPPASTVRRGPYGPRLSL